MVDTGAGHRIAAHPQEEGAGGVADQLVVEVDAGFDVVVGGAGKPAATLSPARGSRRPGRSSRRGPRQASCRGARPRGGKPRGAGSWRRAGSDKARTQPGQLSTDVLISLAWLGRRSAPGRRSSASGRSAVATRHRGNSGASRTGGACPAAAGQAELVAVAGLDQVAQVALVAAGADGGAVGEGLVAEMVRDGGRWGESGRPRVGVGPGFGTAWGLALGGGASPGFGLGAGGGAGGLMGCGQGLPAAALPGRPDRRGWRAANGAVRGGGPAAG
jgi:antitoxin (DNA-binding transcriptional repressor) of toxin-antitoxin stability system